MMYSVLTIIFIVAMLFYFSLADRFNIIDHPNDRSSHKYITIRGGGVIFILAAIGLGVVHSNYWLPISGILVISIISFIDDIFTLSSKLRLLFHLIATTILFFYLNIFHLTPFYICILLYIMVIGIINMYNFMDGINGITGAYSLVILIALQYVNLRQAPFVEADAIWIPIIACLVFLFFNFRKRAKCFAGDVGSVSIAFWIIMLLLKLTFITNNWAYLLFLTVYGVDSVLTIIHRLLLKQNIFKAHRFHFYQVMVNEQELPHLAVATGYVSLQSIIIVGVILGIQLNIYILYMLAVIPLALIYILIKPRLHKVKNEPIVLK